MRRTLITLDKADPSRDSRSKTFEEEIQCHAITNDDYEHFLIFYDGRLGLKAGNDEGLFRFLCEMVHPLRAQTKVLGKALKRIFMAVKNG
ncbi:AbiJ-related protein [Paenibacillus koleovorans]|uniref:AbiJ-related protein n=1 Tax=Paenibacillus koleovorans TaxID=121608 RepID=UPI000FDC0D3F|nr:hypothetical protein [Paenibacillus koleovorans]